MTNFLETSPATATGSRIGVDIIPTLGTGTDIAVQLIKLGYGTDGAFNFVATGTPLDVRAATGQVFDFQQMASATSPVSVGTWTATGQVLVSPLATATQPVSVGTWTATGQVLTSPLATATQPVSVGTWTATGQVLVSPLATATQPVSVGTWTATGTVNVATDLTYPVAVATGFVFSVQQTTTSTSPVSIATWTATGNVNVATDRTYPVAVATEVQVGQGTATALQAVVFPYGKRSEFSKIYTSVSATGLATFATGITNTFRDLVWMVLSNNATVEAQIQVRDTSTSTWDHINLAPDGGGMTFQPLRPVPQAAAGGAWDVQLASAITGQVHIAAGFWDVT